MSEQLKDGLLDKYENHFSVAFNNNFEEFDLVVSKKLTEILSLYQDHLLVFSKEYGDNEFTIAIGYGPKGDTLKIDEEEET